MMVVFLWVILLNFAFQNESSKESKIKAGLPLIARYYDSLSFHKGDNHVNLFFVKPVSNVNKCDSFNYCIFPLILKDDLHFQKFNHYLRLGNRKFILDQYFDSIVSFKYPISDEMRLSIFNQLDKGKCSVYFSRKVLYYIDCNKKKYKIAYDNEPKELDEILEPLPLRKWGH